MAKKLTIMVDDEVYEGLRRVVGPRRIGRFLNDLAKPHVASFDLDEEYKAMAADEDREREALAWIEGVVADVADDPR